MGSPKALLPDRDGVPFIVRIVSSMRTAGLSNLVVVTGRHHDAIVDVLAQSPEPAAALVVRNPDPTRGQLSSLWTALDVCPPGTEAVVMTLVDVPMLAPSTIARVVETWRRTRAPIVRPAFGTRRGHPVIFDRSVFDELRRAPVELGARAVVSAHYEEVVNVPVEDPGCVVDIDTPDEYRRVVRPDQDTSSRGD
jgi:molybdenum cofactor cytidylyltransferase